MIKTFLWFIALHKFWEVSHEYDNLIYYPTFKNAHTIVTTIAWSLLQGDEIVIGFTGGKEKFANSALSELRNRSHYKWDYSTNISGKKRSDWLPGSTVIETLIKHQNYATK